MLRYILYIFGLKLPEDVSSNIEDIVIPGVDIEVSHVIFLVTLTLSGIGVFRVSKYQ